MASEKRNVTHKPLDEAIQRMYGDTALMIVEFCAAVCDMNAKVYGDQKELLPYDKGAGTDATPRDAGKIACQECAHDLRTRVIYLPAERRLVLRCEGCAGLGQIADHTQKAWRDAKRDCPKCVGRRYIASEQPTLSR